MIQYKEINAKDGTFDIRTKTNRMFQEIYSGNLSSPVYIPGRRGWSINALGQADFRYLTADEMHVTTFVADFERAICGSEIITPSLTTLNANFTVPAPGATSMLYLDNMPNFYGQIFAVGDIIRLRQFTRTATSLDVADCWGTVSGWGQNINDKMQWYTFTRSSGTNAGSAAEGAVILKGSIALDYGVSGNGFYEVSAIDGVNGVNSPYAQTVSWATHPCTGSTVKARFGNLSGITSATWGALSG